MARIKRGGRELVVADSDVAGYLEQGYSVIDDKGNAISRAKAVTYEQAIAENAELKDKAKQAVTALEASNTRITELEGQVKALKKDLDAANKRYSTLEASKIEKATSNTPEDKKPAKGNFGLNTAGE